MFSETMFYQYAVVYMCVRIFINVSSTLMNYYIINVLEF